MKVRLFDLALAPFVALSLLPMLAVRKFPVVRIPLTFSLLKFAGVFPIRNHYYEPLFDASFLRRDNLPRDLPGIDFAVERQVDLLEKFGDKNGILRQIPATRIEPDAFFMQNPNFGSGDAEIWYHVIRHFKPNRIVEIGSGYSTQIASLAIRTLAAEDTRYNCEHVCIEPYEMPWLEKLDVLVIRKKLEDADLKVIDLLDRNDILFIDSSHMIRPQGEVLHEFLHILPKLRPGVIVHVHDIFSPRDYPMDWLESPRFWNEQYLLEAFLTHNSEWEVLLAVNMLKHANYKQLKDACPHLDEAREPGSFYMRRR